MADKTGINLYYDYLDNEFAELTLEEVGALTLAILATDDNREIREDARQLICKERFLRTLLSTMNGKTSRATNKWHEINGRFEESRAIKKIMEQQGCSEEEAKKIYFGGNTSGKAKNGTQAVQAVEKEDIPDKWKSLYRTEKFGTGHSVRDLMFLDGEVIKAHFEIANAKNVISQADFTEIEKKIGDVELMKDVVAIANKEGWKEHWETYL